MSLVYRTEDHPSTNSDPEMGEIHAIFDEGYEYYFNVGDFRNDGTADHDDDPAKITKLRDEAKQLYENPDVEATLALINEYVEGSDLFGGECYNGFWIHLGSVEDVEANGLDVSSFTEQDREIFDEWNVFNDSEKRSKLSAAAQEVLQDICLEHLRLIYAKADIWISKNVS